MESTKILTVRFVMMMMMVVVLVLVMRRRVMVVLMVVVVTMTLVSRDSDGRVIHDAASVEVSQSSSLPSSYDYHHNFCATTIC